MDRHRSHEPIHQPAGAGDAQLVEQLAELRPQVGSDLVGGRVRQRPEGTLERPKGLLACLVQELRVGLAVLALVCGVGLAPVHHLLA